MSDNNISVVKAIGAGIRKTEEAVTEIIEALPENFNPETRGAIAELVHAWACPDGNIPAVKNGPKGKQETTDYGRGHDTLTRAVKRALKGDSGATDWLALARQAALNAYNKGNFDADEVMAAVEAALFVVEPSELANV